MTAPVIAIDGPSASGKGTVAARVAESLGFHYLDSGALYRLVTLAAREAGVSPEDEPGLAAVARAMQVEFGLTFPLILADAERVPLRDGCADLVISEFGAAIWGRAA